MKALAVTVALMSFLLMHEQASAQVTPVSNAACAECGGVGSHKPSCRHYVAPKNDSESSSQSSTLKPNVRQSTKGDEPYTDSDNFSSIDGKPLTNKEYWSILMDACTECGAKNNHSHAPDCVIGRSYKWYKEYSEQGKQWDAIRMRDNIVQLKLNTAKGKAMLAAMRNSSGAKPSTTTNSASKPATNTSTNTSTSLKDYTPAPEKPKPAVGNPVMPRPIMVRTPEFSGINEHSIVYDKPQSIDGEHPWGTVDMNAFRQSQKGGWGVFADYDIERYTNTPNGVVILGKRQPDGHILWMWLSFDKDTGKYRAYENENVEEDRSGKKVTLKDIRFEAEGEILVKEYSEGYKRVTNVFGTYIASGYNIKVLPMKVDGHRIVAHGQDPTRGKLANDIWVYDDMGKLIARGEELEYFDDAIIARSKGFATLYNWKGQSIYFDKGGWTSNYADEIQAFTSDKGRYYVIKVKEGRYALETQDFRPVGGFYSTAQEAHDAWNRLVP